MSLYKESASMKEWFGMACKYAECNCPSNSNTPIQWTSFEAEAGDGDTISLVG